MLLILYPLKNNGLPFIFRLVHLFVVICMCICLFVRSFFHSFVRSFVRAFIRSFDRIHDCKFACLFVLFLCRLVCFVLFSSVPLCPLWSSVCIPFRLYFILEI